jgi:hypothetical protein
LKSSSRSIRLICKVLMRKEKEYEEGQGGALCTAGTKPYRMRTAMATWLDVSRTIPGIHVEMEVPVTCDVIGCPAEFPLPHLGTSDASPALCL